MTDDISLDDLSELIGLVYDSALEADQWAGLTQRIIKMFPGHVSMTITYEGARVVGAYTPGGFVSNRAQAIYDENVVEGRPLVAKAESTSDFQELHRRISTPSLGAVRSSRSVWSEEEFRNIPTYKMILEPAGLGHWSNIFFALSGIRSASISFIENERDETAKNGKGLRRLLRLLSPHMVRGARIARALYMAKEAAETYKGFLDAIALPLLIIDRKGIVQMTNTSGQRMLEHGSLFHANAAGQLTFPDNYDDDAFRACLRQTTIDSDPKGLRLDREDGSVSICIAPFHPSMTTTVKSELDMYEREQLYAVFAGAHGDHKINAGLLRDVFQLSEREADVCSALVAGQSPAQIAETSGRAEKTIRNQIQTLHEKVGVTSNRALGEALSVFRTVGAMFDSDDPHLFEAQ
jgi:DNA-binding CsgD family transcriptional regulator